MELSPTDQGWIDALRRFIGDGKGFVPFWRKPDGCVDAEKTVERAFEMYNIKPNQ